LPSVFLIIAEPDGSSTASRRALILALGLLVDDAIIAIE